MNQGRAVAALANADGIELQVEPANWSVVSTPAAGSEASASKAAVAGVVHVCTGVFIGLACAATAQTVITVALRDGATGAGAVLWSKTIAVLAGDSKSIDIDDLSLPGTPGNAMTLEFSSAPVANAQQSCTLTGYDLTQ